MKIRDTAIAGLIAAAYAVLSLAFAPISFAVYQVRIAEALTVLPFLTPAAIPGLYVGCLLANIIGGMGWIDIVIGPLITLAAAFLTRGAYRLTRLPGQAVYALVPVLLMLLSGVYLLTGFAFAAATWLGLMSWLIAAAATLLVERRSARQPPPGDGQLAWTLRPVILAIGVAAAWLMMKTGDTHFMIAGAALAIGALAVLMFLARVWFAGLSPNLLLAPLPPVLLNAFGVSIYLAPIIGVDYWFSVQMIGVGQLIACYVLGLPLLIILQRRRLFPIGS
jgi:uncharacterized membrane protein